MQRLMRRFLRDAFALGLTGTVVACGEPEPAETAAAPDVVEEAAVAAPDAALASEPARRGGAPPAPPPSFPRGLVTQEPGVTPGYVLFSPLLSDTTFLVDNDGQVLHTWKTPYAPGGGQYLLPNGHLIGLADYKPFSEAVEFANEKVRAAVPDSRRSGATSVEESETEPRTDRGGS